MPLYITADINLLNDNRFCDKFQEKMMRSHESLKNKALIGAVTYTSVTAPALCATLTDVAHFESNTSVDAV